MYSIIFLQFIFVYIVRPVPSTHPLVFLMYVYISFIPKNNTVCDDKGLLSTSLKAIYALLKQADFFFWGGGYKIHTNQKIS